MLFHDGDKDLSLFWCIRYNDGYQVIMLQASLALVPFLLCFQQSFHPGSSGAHWDQYNLCVETGGRVTVPIRCVLRVC